ncbi:MAG: tRNA 2-thiouridine(34) synthase MnmA [Candidatus Magasanikbacteria bacterium]|nr:tRNA 2-thiouridine(34) synthase MnmA [Candidatus Magasanikbacteria bacterium]
MAPPKRIKVLCALSGGVDSSVAAALLVRAGYRVTAAFMVNYDDQEPIRFAQGRQGAISNEPRPASCWLPDYRDAVRVAARLEIPIIKLDFTKEYRKFVLNYLFREYAAGRTPNPDILCNKFVKFGAWLTKARELGFDYLATGHYAKVTTVNNYSSPPRKRGPREVDFRWRGNDDRAAFRLLEARDKNKDQTYFLHQLTQAQLAPVLFPLGEYTKPEVRRLAKRWGLPTAEKEESMGICFVGEVPMKEFLQTRIKPKPGKIVLADGTVVGKHDGLAFYTIGQRHSLNLSSRAESRDPIRQAQGRPSAPHSTRPPTGDSLRGGRDDGKPLYVVAKRLPANELVVGYENDPLLYKKETVVAEVNWISGHPPKLPLQCLVRLRHRQPLQRCVVSCYSKRSLSTALRANSAKSRNLLTVRFATPQRAVTPGQFAVFYQPGECLGGGVIS